MSTETEPRVNLLLVDDQPKNLLALEAILEPLGQNLVKVQSGEEALKQLLRMDFAAILLDVQMPDMDGFETAALIKQRPRSRHVPILFLTAISKDDPYVFKGYSVGAVDYLFKPFNPDVLRSKVSVFVELFRKNEKIRQQAELLRVRRERDLAELRKTSEQRYRDLAESMPQIVWTADASGTLTYRNRRWFDCAGIDDDPTRTVGWESLLHPDDQEAFLTHWRQAVEGAGSWEAEYRFGSAAAGHFRWHLVRALPIKSTQKDGVTSWIGTSTDIDDRKRAEQGLRLLAEASTVLASSLDAEAALGEVARLSLPTLGEHCLLCVNDDVSDDQRTAFASTGDAKGEGPTTAAREAMEKVALLLGKDADASVARVLQRDDVNADDHDGEARRTLRDLGLHGALRVPISTRSDVVGTITFATRDPGRRYGPLDVGLGEDLARRIAAAVENARLYAVAERERSQLAEANRAKDEFLAVLSHELRTPLNSMLGWTQIVRAGGLDEKTLARAMDTIERNAKAQAQLIADLLDVSRIVTGKLSVELRPVPLATVVEGALEAARPAAQAHGVKLESHVALDGDVYGDPDRLQQVVSNLLSNAIKFTPSGGSVTLVLARDGNGDDRARLEVIDTGQGIEPEFLPYVFDRFKQGEGATTRVHGGLGLGLAIVRHLVELHHGVVDASSEGKGKGARFSVLLPLLARKETKPPAGREDAALAQMPRDALQGVNVLVVEDDDDGRELLEMVLADYGASVTAVASAQEALDVLATGAHHILVSDIGLPREDGYSLLRRARELEGAAGRIPAIALTAYASGDDRARALAAGFQEHVTKPVEPQELAAAVATLAATARDPHPSKPGPAARDVRL